MFVLVDGDKVSTGSIKDFEKSADVDFGEKYTKVSVIKADKNLAELVMIRTVKKPVPVYYAVTWNVPANTTVAVTAGGTPIASGDKVLAGTSVTITATSTDAANYNVKVDTEAAGTTSTKTVTVTDNTAFAVTTEAIDHSVNVNLVIKGNARVTIDGKTYTATPSNPIKLDPKEYEVSVAWAGSPSALEKTITYDGAEVLAFGGKYYFTAAAGKTLKVGVETVDLTLPANVTATWTTADGLSGTAAENDTTKLPKGASVTATVKAGTTYYVKNGDEYKKANETFNLTASEAVNTVSAAKYHKLTLKNTTGYNKAYWDNYESNGTFSVSLGDTVYVAEGDTCTVALAISGTVTNTFHLTYSGDSGTASSKFTPQKTNFITGGTIASGFESDTLTVSAGAADMAVEYTLQ